MNIDKQILKFLWKQKTKNNQNNLKERISRIYTDRYKTCKSIVISNVPVGTRTNRLMEQKSPEIDPQIRKHLIDESY